MYRTWNEIAELILKIVLQVPVCKEIVRRAGIKVGGTAVRIFLLPMELVQSIRLFTYVTELPMLQLSDGMIRLQASWHSILEPALEDQVGLGNPDDVPDPHPSWGAQVFYTSSGHSNVEPTTVFKWDYTTWQMAPCWIQPLFHMSFPSYSDSAQAITGNYARPGPYALTGPYDDLDVLPNGTTAPYACSFFSDGPGFLPTWHCPPNSDLVAHARVQGRTLYDPFPYPEYPLYFWLDLSEIGSLGVMVGINYQYSSTPNFVRHIWSDDPNDGDELSVNYELERNNYEPRITDVKFDRRGDCNLKLMMSIDGGATWEPPLIRSVNPDGSEITEDPLPPVSWVDPRYSELTAYMTGRLTHASDDGWTIPYPDGEGFLREKFRRDDVLCKFVLETGSENDIVNFSYLGIYGR